MKTSIAIAAGTLLLTLAAPATASPQEYSRGYYDCLAGRYDPEAHSHAYRQGCRAAEREQEGGPGGPPPPPGPGYGGGPGWNGGGGQGWNGGGGPGWNGGGGPGWNGGGGYPPAVRPAGVPNLKGMEPGQVVGAMASRGYRNVGTEVQGAAIYGFYFNPATGECVQVASVNGRAVGAVPTSNPRCR